MAGAASTSLLEPELLEQIKGLSLVARRVVEGVLHGLHRSPLHGLSIEFVQHREYSPGDELKHLDWRVLGRSDRYVIKQYQEETNLRAMILLDCSRSMAYGGRGGTAGDEPAAGDDSGGDESGGDEPAGGNESDADGKIRYARVLAAALSYLMLQQGDSVGLVCTADEIKDQVAPRAAPGHIASICHALLRVEPAGRTDLAAVMAQLAVRLKRRSLVVVISDLLDDPDKVLSALGQIHHRGHEVIVFQVLDPHEVDFGLGLSGRGVTVIRDMETGEEFEAEPVLVRDLVRAEVQRFLLRLDAGARGRGLHLQRCRTDEPVGQVLTRYLHHRLKSWRFKGKVS